MQQGLAFDSNLLGRPLTRRLMLLWMELSGLTAVVLPTVERELTFKREAPSQRERLLDELYERAWTETWNAANNPYELLVLSEDQKELASEVLASFTLRCFPKAQSKEHIARIPDAHILAEAVAANVDMVVTNNMTSIDHTEVNALVRFTAQTNENVVSNADDALLSSHIGPEASRHLLTMFLASAWPERGEQSMTMQECRVHLARCTDSMAKGAAMPNCAAKLMNSFDVDEELDVVLRDAHALAQDSRALQCDNEYASTVRTGRAAINATLGQPTNKPKSTGQRR